MQLTLKPLSQQRSRTGTLSMFMVLRYVTTSNLYFVVVVKYSRVLINKVKVEI